MTGSPRVSRGMDVDRHHSPASRVNDSPRLHRGCVGRLERTIHLGARRASHLRTERFFHVPPLAPIMCITSSSSLLTVSVPSGATCTYSLTSRLPHRPTGSPPTWCWRGCRSRRPCVRGPSPPTGKRRSSWTRWGGERRSPCSCSSSNYMARVRRPFVGGSALGCEPSCNRSNHGPRGGRSPDQ